MSEETTEETATETTETDVKDWQAEAGKWQALARKNEERAKNNAAAAKELEKVRAAAMTDQEKAVAEAELRGRTGALAQVGARLAQAEFRAAAAGKLDEPTLAGFLEYADLTKFIGDDGEPNAKAIDAAVKKLAGTRATDFDGGARTTSARPADMNTLIRRQAGVG